MAAYYNENEPFAAEWLRNLIKAGLIAPGDVDERSITELHPNDLRGYSQCHFFAGIGIWSASLRAAGWPDERPVWTGSCPCQPFSPAGARRGHEDERHLWPAWYGLIRIARPDVIFGEQVSGTDGLAWLDDVGTDLEGSGYALGAICPAACAVGAPHQRHRIYFVAHTLDGRRAGLGGSGQARTAERGEPVRVAHAHSGRTRELARVLPGDEGEHDERPAQRDHAPVGGGATGRVGVPDLFDAAQERARDAILGEQRAPLGRGAVERAGPRAAGRARRGDDPARTQRPGDGEDTRALGDCEFCGYAFDVRALGRYGCPNCLADPDEGGCTIECPPWVHDHGQPGDHAARCGPADRTMANPAGEQRAGGEQGTQPARRGVPAAGSGVGEPQGARPQEREGAGAHAEVSQRGPVQAGAVGGWWGDAEWIWCSDGKWRPTKPGIFPLVDGYPGRVGILRAAGNALVAPLAQTFIEAYLQECP